ncbi:MAG: HAMP domain-containing sensor histidine kinase [Zavarzinella sp.]
MKQKTIFPWWKYIRALAPAVLFWTVLVGWLAYLLFVGTQQGSQNDEANLREWLDEARVFRRTLPELVRQYDAMLQVPGQNKDLLGQKATEIQVELHARTDPIRLYRPYLPMFPEFYSLKIEFLRQPNAPITWDSQLPRPRSENLSQIRTIVHPVLGENQQVIAHIRLEYQLHAYNKLQRDQDNQRAIQWVAAGVVLLGSSLALIWVILFLRRERRRELAREHAIVEMLAAKVNAQEAEHQKEEVMRKLLEQRIEAARAEARIAQAEHENLQMKSQLYASIGIMAGSYAHNIKNLLVRPNDLISRCLESPDNTSTQVGMLHEVRETLATVTERLQMILRTVRRDPTKTEQGVIDLNQLVGECGRTWESTASSKWKLIVKLDLAAQPLQIRGDASHLQQALENLLFNARDATFEMRNHLRQVAHDQQDSASKKKALLAASAWKGEVVLRTLIIDNQIVMEVVDNGIGMTPEVKESCLETHFSTKRDNALYEGYSAGMGLGLSFVAVVLEHHAATLKIESEPESGTTFRIIFPNAPDENGQ